MGQAAYLLDKYRARVLKNRRNLDLQTVALFTSPCRQERALTDGPSPTKPLSDQLVTELSNFLLF
jgi:hypothetical protein